MFIKNVKGKMQLVRRAAQQRPNQGWGGIWVKPLVETMAEKAIMEL